MLSLGFGEGEDVVMDHNYQTVATVTAGNGYQADLHDFQIAPDNVAYLTAYNVDALRPHARGRGAQRRDLDTAVQEVDIKTGLVRWEWHSLDHVGVSESHAPVPTTATPWDWFHLNSIDVEPERGPADLRAQHLGGLPAGRAARADPVARWAAPAAASRWAPANGNRLAARRAHAARRDDHDVRRRLRPAHPLPVARACTSRSTRPTTPRACCAPIRIPAARCSPTARATCRRSPTATS